MAWRSFFGNFLIRFCVAAHEPIEYNQGLSRTAGDSRVRKRFKNTVKREVQEDGQMPIFFFPNASWLSGAVSGRLARPLSME